jgi:hypothetical protein
MHTFHKILSRQVQLLMMIKLLILLLLASPTVQYTGKIKRQEKQKLWQASQLVDVRKYCVIKMLMQNRPTRQEKNPPMTVVAGNFGDSDVVCCAVCASKENFENTSQFRVHLLTCNNSCPTASKACSVQNQQ